MQTITRQDLFRKRQAEISEIGQPIIVTTGWGDPLGVWVPVAEWNGIQAEITKLQSAISRLERALEHVAGHYLSESAIAEVRHIAEGVSE